MFICKKLDNMIHLFLDFFQSLHSFGWLYILTPHSAQESGIGHCNFSPERDYSEILIT